MLPFFMAKILATEKYLWNATSQRISGDERSFE
ncbi:hypothetical protein CA85_02740 [Allorhodopirellula solitaria]|uniref:Uncharacterized protein n=1 Tax=Allorhodopirellula solitaria TaxID=2527987 RepID=A0A5C5YJD4_9BACT|nr:hypothetical protein CA85_02740 [Allorhodopirellula solitaria]